MNIFMSPEKAACNIERHYNNNT